MNKEERSQLKKDKDTLILKNLLQKKFCEYNTPKKSRYLLDKLDKLEGVCSELESQRLTLIKEIELLNKYHGTLDLFPTTRELTQLIKDQLPCTFSDSRILEPSAGLGVLADMLKQVIEKSGAPGITLDLVEYNYDLSEFLKSKGHENVFNCDFMEFNPEYRYDLIVMNPPFSHIHDHIQHAYDLLNDSGVIFVVVPSNFQPKQLDLLGFHLQSERFFSFKESGTGINCRLACISKKLNKNLAHAPTNLFSCYLDGSYTSCQHHQEIIKKLSSLSGDKLKQYVIELYCEWISKENYQSITYIKNKVMTDWDPLLIDEALEIAKDFVEYMNES